jgi:hypothetical protein
MPSHARLSVLPVVATLFALVGGHLLATLDPDRSNALVTT